MITIAASCTAYGIQRILPLLYAARRPRIMHVECLVKTPTEIYACMIQDPGAYMYRKMASRIHVHVGGMRYRAMQRRRGAGGQEAQQAGGLAQVAH